MCLKVEFIDELKFLAKNKNISGLVLKMREVMVNRHPATLSQEEQDPVETVAMAWKEVSIKGRKSFELATLSVIRDNSDPQYILEIQKLLPMLPFYSFHKSQN